MWRQKIYNLLEQNQIVFEFVHTLSVFNLLFIPQHQLYLHLIDLKTFQENDLSNSYFRDFSDKFNAQNQRIIHLWEDIYLTKPDLVESRILAILGKFTRLHARHCIIERIDKPTADRFLEINHLQGSVKAKFKYGLFLKAQYLNRFEMNICDDKNPQKINIPMLIGVATFSGGRSMKVGQRNGKRSYELIRFASLRGYVVVGGMDKLLKVFIKDHEPDDVMSYIDRDWSNGRSYDILGFRKIESSLPQTFFINFSTLTREATHWFTDETGDKYFKIFNAGSVKYIKEIIKRSSLATKEDLVIGNFL